MYDTAHIDASIASAAFMSLVLPKTSQCNTKLQTPERIDTSASTGKIMDVISLTLKLYAIVVFFLGHI